MALRVSCSWIMVFNRFCQLWFRFEAVIAALRVRCRGSWARNKNVTAWVARATRQVVTHAEIALEQSGQILCVTFASECALT